MNDKKGVAPPGPVKPIEPEPSDAEPEPESLESGDGSRKGSKVSAASSKKKLGFLGGLKEKKIVFAATKPGACCLIVVGVYAVMIGLFLMFTSTPHLADMKDFVPALSKLSREHDTLSDAFALSAPLNPALKEDKGVEREQMRFEFSLSLSFKHRNKDDEWEDSDDEKDIFTPKNVQTMCKVEKVMIKDKNYPKACVLGQLTATEQIAGQDPRVNELSPNRGCMMDNSLSITEQFYGSFYSHNMTCNLLSEAVVAEKKKGIYDTVLANDFTNPMTGYLGFFVSKDMPSKGHTHYTRSVVPVGFPIKGFKMTDAVEEQNKVLQEMLWGADGDGKLLDAYFRDLFGKSHGMFRSGWRRPFAVVDDLEIHMFSFSLFNAEYERMNTSDMKYFMLAMVFVFCYVWFYTDALFIAIFAMLNLVLNIPVAGATWSGVLQINYFPNTMIMVFFIMLGIGADCLFVFFDAYKQARQSLPKSAVIALLSDEDAAEDSESRKQAETDLSIARMHLAYDRALHAVFNTTCTTSAAFFAVGLSDVPFLSALGNFAAICIITMYVMAMISYPPLHALYFREKGWYFGKNWCCCCFWRPVHFRNELEEEAYEKEKYGDIPADKRCESKLFVGLYDAMTKIKLGGKKTEGKEDVADDEDDTKIFKFYPLPCVSLVFLQIIAIWGMYQASLMETPSELPVPFPPDHSLAVTPNHFRDGFLAAGSDNLVGLELSFGLRDVDRTDFNKRDPYNTRGDPMFHSSFEMYTPDAVATFVELCDKLDAAKCPNKECENVLTGNKFIDSETMNCPMREFLTFHGVDVSETVSGASGYPAVRAFQSNSCCDSKAKFHDSLRQFRFNQTPKYAKMTWKNLIGFTESGELQYMALYFKYAIAQFQGYNRRIAMIEEMDKFVKDFSTKRDVQFLTNLRRTVVDVSYLPGETEKIQPEAGSDAVESLGPLIQGNTESFWWIWTAVERGLTDSLWTGLIFTFPVAFLVLIFATGNVLLALYSTLTIANIVFLDMGILRWYLEWELNFVTVIVVVVSVGFSCDYVLHVGHMYAEAAQLGIKRSDLRTRYSFARMGSTIIAASITTAAAGIALFMAETSFFKGIGFVICFTIFLSVIYTFGFYAAICMQPVLGPSGSRGFLPGWLPTEESVAEQKRRNSITSDTYPTSPEKVDVKFVDEPKDPQSPIKPMSKTPENGIVGTDVNGEDMYDV
jgi:hypothetical protein